MPEAPNMPSEFAQHALDISVPKKHSYTNANEQKSKAEDNQQLEQIAKKMLQAEFDTPEIRKLLHSSGIAATVMKELNEYHARVGLGTMDLTRVQMTLRVITDPRRNVPIVQIDTTDGTWGPALGIDFATGRLGAYGHLSPLQIQTLRQITGLTQ